MSNNIIQKLKYKESIVKFSYKYGVTKAAIKFGECRRAIYRWRDRYDGTLESLKDKSRKPHYHPNQHTEEEIKLIKIIKLTIKKQVWLYCGLNYEQQDIQERYKGYIM